MSKEEYVNYLYDTYSRTILSISYIYLKNTHSAEDILQDVLLKVVKKEIQFQDVKKIGRAHV